MKLKMHFSSFEEKQRKAMKNKEKQRKTKKSKERKWKAKKISMKNSILAEWPSNDLEWPLNNL